MLRIIFRLNTLVLHKYYFENYMYIKFINMLCSETIKSDNYESAMAECDLFINNMCTSIISGKYKTILIYISSIF